jgi:hypothetical protein
MLSFSHRHVYQAYSEPCICLFFDVGLAIASRKTATKRMSTELPQEQWGKTPAMFHPRHYAESRTNSFTFCLAPASPRISRCNHCFGMGVNLVARLRRRHPGMRERARHFGGDMRIESSHNGTKISFLFPSSRDRPHCDRAGFDPKSNNPALSIPFRPPGW